MPTGYVIAESLRPGARLEGLPLSLISIERQAVDSATADQPPVWTMIHFDFPEGEASRLADAFADVLDDGPGWYADFDAEGEKFVVFPGRVMRYPLGDKSGRAEAEAHARTLGIPEAQLDW